MMDEKETIRVCLDNIHEGKDVRESLINLKNELKENSARETLAELLDNNYSFFYPLLKEEDPKIRKNAALILGIMKSEESLPILFDTYQKEETLYVRPDYLKAISKLNYMSLGDELEQRLTELRNSDEWEPEEQKHISEEIRILQEMVLHCRGIRRHRFSGGKERETVILLTNRRFREETAEQVHKGKITLLAGGLKVEGASVKEISSIRTYSELLFPINAGPLRADDPVQCGTELAKPVLEMADQLYRGAGAFLFRVGLRGKAEFANGAYIRKIADAIEKGSDARLINSVTNYEIEIRLVLRKDGTYAAMMKPSADFDQRFAYRRESVSASIAPVNAALTSYLTRSWLMEGAQVLDPFCGVGTMLIERDRTVKTGAMYGIDIFGEAIEKARRNTQRAGCRVNYINRDFFTFKHNYPFDEVITDLPTTAGDGTKRELRNLIHRFFDDLQGLLKDEAVLVLYTTAPNYVVESVRETEVYRIEKSFLINEKNGTTVFVVSFRRFR